MKSQATILKENLEAMYDTADVTCGFNYWFNKLLGIMLGMFKYSGLPESLKRRELELNLLLTNHAVVFERKGKLVTTNTSITGYDSNYYPTEAVYSQPKLGSGRLMIGKDCEIIYNNYLMDNIFYLQSDGSMYTFIARYARQLADIESTASIYAVNMRASGFPTASTDTVIRSLKDFFTSLALGKRAVISDSSILQEFRTEALSQAVHDGINDWLTARDKILEQYMRDIGVKWNNQKRAQQSEEEVEADTQLLVIDTKAMLACRQEGIEKVNKMYGTNIAVELAPEFDREKYVGGNTNEIRSSEEE